MIFITNEPSIYAVDRPSNEPSIYTQWRVLRPTVSIAVDLGGFRLMLEQNPAGTPMGHSAVHYRSANPSHVAPLSLPT